MAGDTNGDGTGTTPAPGDWGGILGKAGSQVTLTNCQFAYGGQGMVSSSGGSLSLSRCALGQASGAAVAASGALVQVYRCVLNANGTGVSASGSMQGSFVAYSSITGNNFGVSNSGPVLDARYNWWGDVSGPYDPSDDRTTGGWYNPTGKGDRVSDLVRYDPWLGGALPPPPPSGLAAVATAPTAIRLNWIDAAGGAAGAEIQRKIGGGDYAPLTTAPPGTTLYRDTGLTPLTTYTYRVRAVNAAGDSDWSNEASATTPSANTTYTISGTVTAGGVPLAGVAVSAGSGSAATGSNGSYAIGNLSAGVYTLTPALAGYTFTPASRTVEVGPDQSGIDFSATPTTFTISGTVREGANGLRGVIVNAGAASATTGADGTYSLAGLAAGSYTVTAAKAEYTFAPANRSVTIGPNQSGVDFTANRITYTISGTLREGSKGLVGVTLSAGAQSGTTAADGTYTITGLVSGTYSVTPTKAGYGFAPSSRPVTLGPSQAGVDFAGTRTYSIGGTVTTKGAGLAGVTVTAGGRSTTTSSSGSYAMSGLVPGVYTVQPTLAGYRFNPVSRRVRVGPDAKSVNFVGVPPPPPPSLSRVSVKPNKVKGGGRVTVTVTLTGGALQAVTVALSTSDSAAAPVPSSVTVPAGKTSAAAVIAAGRVMTATTVTISATYNGTTRTASLTVNP